jgi:hypothetical protein
MTTNDKNVRKNFPMPYDVDDIDDIDESVA